MRSARPAARPKASKPEARRVDDGSVTVGLAHDSERLIRRALSSQQLEDSADADDGAFVVGEAVLARYDGEWYDATVFEVGDDAVTVYYDEYDEYETLTPDMVCRPEELEDEEDGADDGGGVPRAPGQLLPRQEIR